MLQFFPNKSLSLNWKTTGGNNANLHLNIITYTVESKEHEKNSNSETNSIAERNTVGLGQNKFDC